MTKPTGKYGFTLLAAGILLGPPLGPARADTDWPQRPIRVVLPYAPGGSTDATARLVAMPMTQSLPPFVPTA